MFPPMILILPLAGLVLVGLLALVSPWFAEVFDNLLAPFLDIIAAVVPEKLRVSTPQTPGDFKLTAVSAGEIRVTFRPKKSKNILHREEYIVEIAKHIQKEDPGLDGDDESASSDSGSVVRPRKAGAKGGNNKDTSSKEGTRVEDDMIEWSELGVVEWGETSFLVDNLPPGFMGEFRMRAVNARGKSEPTTGQKCKTLQLPNEDNGGLGPVNSKLGPGYTAAHEYIWGQTKDIVTVRIPILDGIKGKDVSLTCKPTWFKLEVNHAGSNTEWLGGRLGGTAIPDDFTWQIDTDSVCGRHILCHITKMTSGEKWKNVIKGHPQIAVTEVKFGGKFPNLGL